jgi:hypothetical protein
MAQKTRLFRKTAEFAAAVGVALLLSGCIIVPPPYHHSHHSGYYGWR